MRAFGSLLLLFLPQYILADPSISTDRNPAILQEKLCLGYQSATQSWGQIGDNSIFRDTEQYCPPNTAFISLRRIGGPAREGRHIPVIGNCCPVPEDLLTATHTIEAESCPDGSVATGSLSRYIDLPKECTEGKIISTELWRLCSEYYFTAIHSMRCTKINSKRYELGPERPARFWGIREHLSHNLQYHVQRASIPAAIRHSVGRATRESWYSNGCIGFPYGSLLTRKSGKRCEFHFRQVLYAGAAGDPPKGTPAEMFPNCKAVSDRFNPEARCIK